MKIFISASSKDYLETTFIINTLRALDLNGEITFWYADNSNVPIGSELSGILENIEESQGAILLVSNNFLNSEFIIQEELPAILKKLKESNNNYKLIPVLLDRETNFGNFEEISVQKIKYINSKSTAFRELGESESYSECNKIMNELLTKHAKDSSEESRRTLKRIELINIMIKTLENEYQSNISELVQNFIASGGTHDNYSSTRVKWAETLSRYKEVAETTLYELTELKNLNKKMKTLDEHHKKQMEDVIDLVKEFIDKVKKSIIKACEGLERFDNSNDAEKAIKSTEHENQRSIYLCPLCKNYHIGLEYIIQEEEFENEPMMNWVDDLRDDY